MEITVCKKLSILILLSFFSCAPKVHFIKVGWTIYPPKPNEYEILVFREGSKPEKEYRVVGMVFTEVASDILDPFQASDSKILNQLKKEAKKHGADAIIDLKIISNYENLPDPDTIIDRRKTKRAEAKAVVFVEEKDF
jgi:hypothetical protein